MMDEVKSGNLASAVIELGVLLKQLLHDLLNIIVDTINGAIDLIADLTASALDILNLEVPSAIADIWNLTLKPLFGLTSDLVYWSDLGFFITGFITNIAGTIYSDALKVDVHGVLTDSSYHDAVISALKGSSATSSLSLQDDHANWGLAATALSLSATIVQSIARLPAVGKTDRIKMLATGGFLGVLPADIIKYSLLPAKATILDDVKYSYNIAAQCIFGGLLNLWSNDPNVPPQGIGTILGILDLGDTALYIAQLITETAEVDDTCTICLESFTAINAFLKIAIAYTPQDDDETRLIIIATFIIVGLLTASVDILKITGNCS